MLEGVLSEAVGMENTKTVRTLLEFGVSPDTNLLYNEPAPLVSGRRLDALSRAARKISIGVIALLVRHGGHANSFAHFGIPPGLPGTIGRAKASHVSSARGTLYAPFAHGYA